jgi:amidohydrolase
MDPLFLSIAAECREIRHRLHARPELSGAEFATRDAVVAELRALGFDPQTFADDTGVVALWNGAGPGAAASSTALALRADMDALPLQEESSDAWKSQVAGVMHACGHDGHTAVLLGVARWLVSLEKTGAGKRFSQPVKLIFQPAEETGLGAPGLIQAGVLENPRVGAIFALHGWPELPAGTFAIPDRAIMAAVDNFTLTLRGRGGHGAMPQLARDPVVAAAALILGAQTLVSRKSSPLEAAVLTFGQVAAGKTHNVIPETCLLRGTLRTLNPALRAELMRDFEAMTNHVSAAHGVTAEMEWVEACPATLNDPAMAALARAGVRRALGDDCLRDVPPSMGGEDFSYFLHKVPGAYFWLGLGMERGGLHNPRFDFNDEALAAGIAAFAGIVEEYFDRSIVS